MDFNPDEKTQEELREFFKVPKGKSMNKNMNEKMLESVKLRLKTRQLEFFAFLNKEFNVMNYKSARCSMHCFDDTKVSMNGTNHCLKVCREGITNCRDFAQALQDKTKAEHELCVKEAPKLEKLTDPVVHWMSCQEKVILKFDTMESSIKNEFSNFI